jgi:ESCRT-I complex subunit TSG101
LELVAEDNAIEDAIYHLGRYFNSDTRTQNELERFLKVRLSLIQATLDISANDEFLFLCLQRTRILARDQFMKRAMINKILLEIALSRAQRS